MVFKRSVFVLLGWARPLACIYLLGALLLGALLLVGATAHAEVPVRISLIALNDLHGNLLPPAGSLLVPDPASPQGTRVAAGGAAYLASLVRELKARNPGRTLLVGAGDLVGAAPLASSLFHDEPTIAVLNQMEMRVSSVGNHEFDRGRKELLRLQQGGCYPPADDGSAGVIGKDTCMDGGQFAGARFQYLAANVIDNRTDQTLFPATAVQEIAGVKIGFIGVTLRSTALMVPPAGIVGLRFLDEVATVNRLVPLLKAQGVAVVVVLIHQGGQTSARMVQDAHCPDFSGPILGLADRFDAAVDVVVSGHTHQEYVCVRPDGKLVTQAGSHGRLLTHIDLEVDAKANRLLSKVARNHVVLNGSVVTDARGNALPLPPGRSALVADAAVDSMVRRYGDLTAPLSEMEVGRIATALDRRTNAAGESTLGAVIADAYLAATADASNGNRPAQIAFTNPGGLRSDLNSSLTVTHGQLFNVIPFNNRLITMDLTGHQIRRLLEQQWERPQPAGGHVMPLSSGFSYVWDASQPAGATPGTGRRVVPGSMRLNGEPLEMDKLYRVSANSFMVSGGDSFNIFKRGLNMQEGEWDLVAVKLYFRLKGTVPAPQMGRIQRIN